MELFILFAVICAVAIIWSRIDKLERRVANLADQLDYVRYRQTPQSVAAEGVAPEPEPSVETAAEATTGVGAAQLAPGNVQGDGGDASQTSNLHEASQPLNDKPPQSDIEPAAAEPAMAYETGQNEHQTQTLGSRLSFDFEDIFGRRLPIWGGGFALAIAGIFLVRFSIEAGLLTPSVRVIMSFLFGISLLVGAEAAFRFEGRLDDPRVRQSLSGAGLATLYGAFYLAGTTYGLIGAGAAFVGLAIVTAAAIALSFRFGLPSAVIALVGGFAAPLLVDSDSSNIPLLSFYLALITGGLAWSGQAQGRNWLGYAALALGLGWGGLLMFLGVSRNTDFAALGIYFVVLGTVLPAFLHSKGGPSLPILAAGGIATLQMADLVSDAGFAPLTWGLYLLIGAALTALGWRFPALRLGTLVAAGLGLWLLIIWPDPSSQMFAIIAACQVAIFAGVPLAYQWLGRVRLLDLAQLSAVSLVMGIVLYVQFGGWGELATEPALAASMLGLALLPGAAFALMWSRQEERDTRHALLLLAPALMLVFAGLLLVTPAWFAPVTAAIVSAVPILLRWRRNARALMSTAWAGAMVAIVALVATPHFLDEVSQLGLMPTAVDTIQAALRWSAAAAIFASMAWVSRDNVSRGVGEAMAVALIYGVVAQIIPSTPLAWVICVAAIILFVLQERRTAAWAMALVIGGLWILAPFANWLLAGSHSLVGQPFLAESAIESADIVTRVLPFGAALAVLFWKGRSRRIEFRSAALLGLGILASVTLHSLYKHVWDISSLLQFEIYGMGERTILQAILMLAAYGISQIERLPARRYITAGLIALSLSHFVWFTLVLHNPLLTVQQVGPTPIANWLTLAYITAIGGIWLGSLQWKNIPTLVRHGLDAVTMLLISMLAYSLLRQIFAGSILTSSVIGQNESLLISMLGILLALGFLWWGSWKNQRSWRIGSLVFMLIAVIKVFLIDAAGLEGLLRIFSFMALGFSLIGIGWVYSRQLSRRALNED